MCKLILAVSVMCLLCACQKDDEFVGQWVAVKDPCSTLAITQNGDHLLAKIKSLNIFMGLYNESAVPAAVTDGTLTIQLARPVAMTVEKASGELVGGDARYRRPNGSEKCSK